MGPELLGNAQAEHISDLMRRGELYAGSDGSVKDGLGAHAYGFTSGRHIDKFWGGAAPTPGNEEEMASLRTELGGAMGVLLVVYALQIQRGASLLPVTIWLDNAEVLERANNPIGDANLK